MASLVGPLACGIAGAPSGTAEFFNEGTGTLATVYSDAEGVTQVTSHTLDAYGGIVRYVEDRTDVVVKDVNGATVRTFTWGTDAREVRVENAGFTGTTATGATAAGGRTTVDAVLSALFASLGATDGKALVSGVAVNISDALAGISGLVFNVTNYGGAGDDSTDNKAAITATIAAAITAGGGEIFFPPGTYRVAGQVIVPAGSKVVFRGASPGSVSIKQMTTATAGMFLVNDPTCFTNITFTRNAAAMTGSMVKSASRVLLVDCVFAGWGGNHLFDDEVTAAAEFKAVGCTFTLDEAACKAYNTDGDGTRAHFIGCSFVVTANAVTLFNNDGAGDIYVTVSGGCSFRLSGTAPIIVNSITYFAMGASIALGTAGATTYTFGALYNVLTGNILNFPGGTLTISTSGGLYEASNFINASTVNLPAFFQSTYRESIAPLTTTLIGADVTFTPAAVTPINFVTYPGTNVGTLTVAAPTGSVAPGTKIQIIIYQSGASGPSAITWNGTYSTYDTGGAHPALTASIAQNAVLRFAFTWEGARWVQCD